MHLIVTFALSEQSLFFSSHCTFYLNQKARNDVVQISTLQSWRWCQMRNVMANTVRTVSISYRLIVNANENVAIFFPPRSAAATLSCVCASVADCVWSAPTWLCGSLFLRLVDACVHDGSRRSCRHKPTASHVSSRSRTIQRPSQTDLRQSNYSLVCIIAPCESYVTRARLTPINSRIHCIGKRRESKGTEDKGRERKGTEGGYWGIYIYAYICHLIW